MKFTNALGGCANCGALTSPCWRKGPDDAKHLCNACGSRYLVKGTLEGYKPGLKSRAGTSKRGKASKSKPYPGSSHSDSIDRHCSDSPQKRVRLFKEHSHHFAQYVEKGTQTMSPAELQAYCDNGSPKSPLDFKLDPHDNYLDANPSIHQDKDSSDESSPEACELAAGGKTVRRRARKPFRPTVSTW